MRLPRDFEKNVISALLAVLVPVMLFAAFTRHLFPEIHPDVLKIAAACLAWLSSLGIARAAALNAHIQIPVIKNLVSGENRRRLQFVADAAFLVFSIASLLIGIVVLYRSLVRPDVAGSPAIYASLPTGSALTIVRLLGRLCKKEPAP